MKSPYKGLLFALTAPLFYALKSVFVKAAPSTNIETLVFFRFLFDFLILSPFFIKYRKHINLNRIRFHSFRAALAILALFFSIYGIQHLTLADSILLESTLPLFIPLIFMVWSRTKISKSAIYILLLGFFGLSLLIKPELDLLHFASFAPLGTALLTSITSVSIRFLSETEHPIAILFYYYVFCGIGSLLPCLYSWEGISPSLWSYLLAISIFGVLFQFTNTRAFSLLSPPIAGCFLYFGVLYAVFFGWLFWNERIDTTQLLGGSLLILAGILITKENARFQVKTERESSA